MPQPPPGLHEQDHRTSYAPRGGTSAQRSRSVAALSSALVDAGRREDRTTFDRIFDVSFRLTYALAWLLTHNVARSETVTAQLLVSVLDLAVRENGAMTPASRG